MRILASILPIAIALTNAVHTTASDQEQTHNPNAAWEFSLYQNTRCTGAVTVFSGSATTACQVAILNGGAKAYIPNNFTETTCILHLFEDTECSRDRIIQVIGAPAVESCNPVPRVKDGQSIRSYFVEC